MDSDLLDALPGEGEETPQTASAESSEPISVSPPSAPPPPRGEAEKTQSSGSVSPGISPTVQEPTRVDVSAATVARMMGIASTSDLRLIEGKLDLLTSRVAALLTKVDRCISMFSSVPTPSDIGRIEVQLAAVKAMMKEVLDSVGAPTSSQKEQTDKDLALEQSRKLRSGIKTNAD